MPRYNFKGFSLIEVLVVVALIGIVVGVSVPNLRQFGAKQEIEAAASQLINTLRTAQSSAAAHIKCSDGQVSNNWNVVLNSTGYSLNSNCPPSGIDRKTFSSAYVSGENASTVFTMTNVCASQDLKLTFAGQHLIYQCGGFQGTTWPVKITLSNAGGTLSKVIVVEAGGVIRSE